MIVRVLCMHRLNIRKALPLMALALCFACYSLAFANEVPASASRFSAQISKKYGTLPLSFERNQGQASGAVRYLAHGPGYSILLKERGATLLLSKRSPVPAALRRPAPLQIGTARTANSKTDVLQMRLVGSRASTQVTGDEPLLGTVNYFTGNSPDKWITGVPTFGRVKYTNIYRGIDLVYYGSRQQLEFDFELAPGADSRRIRMRFSGARKLSLDKQGNLTILGANGEIQFHKPEIYQPLDGGRMQPVSGAFHLSSKNTVSFRLGSYSHSKPLVIDPILSYSTYIGTGGFALGVAVDSAGNAYVAGDVYGYASMPAAGGIQPSMPTKSPSSFSAFVAKLNSTGTALDYCTYLSGSGVDEATAVAVDSAGDAYVGGYTSSPDFPVTTDAFQTTMAGAFKVYASFVTKINASGTALVYSTYLGGSANTTLDGIAVDSSGSAYVTGYTGSLDFPTTPGAFQTTNDARGLGDYTGFISKLNPGGTGLAYSTYIGGGYWDQPSAIVLDATGSAYITGSTGSSDFPTTAGAYQPALKGGWDLFVTKMKPTGTALVYSTFLGGSSDDFGLGIAVDSSGGAYVAGISASSDLPTTPGVFQPNPVPAQRNFFVSKLDSLGTGLVYSTFLGQGSEINVGGIAVDASGNAYVTGVTHSLDYPVTPGALQTQNTSLILAFVDGSFLTEINGTGTALVYSTYLSGSGFELYDHYPLESDAAQAIALDDFGNAYVVGGAVSSDFPTTLGAYQNYGTNQDILDEVYNPVTFVTKFNASELKTLPATTTTLTASANPQAASTPVTFTATVHSTSGTAPTGTVGFSTSEGPSIYPPDMSPWSAVTLDGSGNATYTISTLPQGTDTVNAYYLGDANNAPSSGSITESITGSGLNLPVVVTVTSSVNPALYGTPVTFHISVEDASGKGQPEGSIEAMYLFGSIPLDSSGNAIWTTSSLPPGANKIDFEFFSSNNDYGDGSVYYTENVTPLGTATAPVISPPSGIVSASSQTVTITDPTPGQIIFYEILPEGSTVTPFSGNPYNLGYYGYTGPITINQSQTVAAATYEDGYNWSPTVSANYTLAPYGQAPPPSFSPPGGVYTSAQIVSIKDSVASATIHYTTDGSQPTESSPVYGNSIQVNSSETIQAIATGTGYLPSLVAAAFYTVNLPAPDFSISVSPATLSVYPGGATTTTLTLSSLNGFSQNVSFACSGLPTGATCSFSPSTVVPSGSSSSTTLTISASSTASIRQGARFHFVPVSTLALALCWAGFKKRHLRCVTLVMLLGSVSALALGGCGGGGSGGQVSQNSPVTSTVTVTASSGSLSHSAKLTLIVE